MICNAILHDLQRRDEKGFKRRNECGMNVYELMTGKDMPVKSRKKFRCVLMMIME